MAPKSKKAQKLNLNDFLADTSTGRSWADEMDDLPTAPAPREPNESSRSGLGGSHLSRNEGNRYGDRDGNRRGGGDRNGFDRPQRAEVPIPDKPPFNAFVGNLSWEVGSTELEQVLGAANIISIRMINDNITGKPKGYGYVEFDARDALVAALEKSGQEIGGRPIRVSVAEPPKEREDRTGGAWRRDGPLPSNDDGRRSRYPSNNYDRTSMDDSDRGERMGFGSKFVPSSNDTQPNRRTHSGRGFSRAEGGPSDNENADRGERMGFGSKFMPSAEEPRKDREPPVLGKHFVSSRATPAGSEDGNSIAGSVRRHGQNDRKSSEIGPTAADSVSNWRSERPNPPPPTSDREPPAAPPTRRKLELTARTIPADGILTPPQSVTSIKPSPFGSAKPVDSTEREKAIEEKLDREREELAAVVAKKSASAIAEENKNTGSIQPAQPSSTSLAQAPESSPKPVARPPKSNPFGAAKPVDTLQKELEIEEKLEKEKKLLEEKVRKEAEEAKAASKSSTTEVNSGKNKEPSKLSSSNTATAPSAPTSQSNNNVDGSSNAPTSKVHNPNSRWRSQAAAANQNSKSKQPNGNSLNHSTSSASTATPLSNETVVSPKSPSLSSFRKEGVSFAALAKTAASTPAASQTQAQPAATKSVKDVVSKQQNSQPRTILKRNEEAEKK
ncbi:hypothetical protein PPACK8108_LOCUS11581 [Phakopsora pachyrhizi]|uniref:RRM domain-containing protein n=1 Tax=Phakopsora pachyrhizi TaxID=170000 RepID=A0AAV0B0H4_PHAPC|nr:hypothetical protein PPACK8108_LOCUS11581 [Phakopsora pachyrhizi]